LEKALEFVHPTPFLLVRRYPRIFARFTVGVKTNKTEREKKGGE